MNSLHPNKSTIKRFTKSSPCPICRGYEQAPRGSKQRCYGFISGDGKYAHCTREEHAHGLPLSPNSKTYAHRMEGPCNCGAEHGPARYESSPARNGNGNKRDVVARYNYLDKNEELLLQVCRTDPKGFFQQRPDGAGNWISSLDEGEYFQSKNGKWYPTKKAEEKGWTIPPDAPRKHFPAARRVLYHLPELLSDPKEPVFIVEGEKDVERLELIELVATCNPEGAGKWRFVAEQAREILAGRLIVILPDNDTPGRDHALDVARSLYGAAASIKVVALPGLPEKGDVADWIEARLLDGMSLPDIKAALLDIVNAAQAWQPPADVAPTGAADTAQATEPPLPLVRVIEPAKPFPVDALGPILGPAAKVIQRATKAPMAMCGNSVLAAATLAVQPYADIEIDGRVFPLSNFFLTVGTTGERKTAVDDLALFPHKEIQDTRTDEYKREKKLFEKEMEIYKKAKDKALSQKNKERDAMREALAQLGDPPTPPRSPLLLLDDPTIEGLLKHYHDLGCSSLGIFSGEGARFLGGYGMNPENMLRTAGGLSDLWGGKPLNRIRAGDGTIVVRGRRLSIHLMAQPNVAALLLDNLALEEQGLLPRFLFVWPESTCGTRMYEAFNAHNVPEFQQYRQRIKEILDAPLPFREDSESELRPRRIRLSADAKEAFIRFHDGVEEQIKEGEELHPIKGIACKAAEHAARLAAVIELTNNLDAESVRFDSMAQGIILMQHYLSEALRIKTSAISDAKILKAQALLDWLHKNGKKIITLAEAYQRGPNQIRDKKTAMDAFGILEDHNWIIPLPGGAEYDGMKRKVAWEVRS
ncbi:MAG: DUF3987 domain-containing protein [Candidatus Omnitrophica bacterium]|nr:DUF3987 domain-containing protein [Candidatus Omnitrophota bacterium]